MTDSTDRRCVICDRALQPHVGRGRPPITCSTECRQERRLQMAWSKTPTRVADTKVCSRCSAEKPATEFHRDRRRTDGRFPYCKACRLEYDGRTPRKPPMFATKAEYDRAHRQTMPAREKATRHREKHLWTTFRITPDDYEAMLESQGGVCAICGETEVQRSHLGTPKHFAVDHDHSCCPGNRSCGECVRGLLCHRCNYGLGQFKDDPQRMRAAIDYLESHPGGDAWPSETQRSRMTA